MSGIKRTVLLAHLQDIDVPHHLGPAIVSVTTATAEALVIVLVSQLFHTSGSTSNRVQQWDRVQSLLTYVYVKATKAAQDLGKVLLDISVVLKDPSQSLPNNFWNGVDMCFRIQGGASLSPALSVHHHSWRSCQDPPVPHLPNSIGTLPQVFVVPDKSAEAHQQQSVRVTPSCDTSPSSYPVVALGGTFDHLHAGHKILLSMAAWIASTKVIVGVTGMIMPCNLSLLRLNLSSRRRAIEE